MEKNAESIIRRINSFKENIFYYQHDIYEYLEELREKFPISNIMDYEIQMSKEGVASEEFLEEVEDEISRDYAKIAKFLRQGDLSNLVMNAGEEYLENLMYLEKDLQQIHPDWKGFLDIVK